MWGGFSVSISFTAKQLNAGLTVGFHICSLCIWGRDCTDTYLDSKTMIKNVIFLNKIKAFVLNNVCILTSVSLLVRNLTTVQRKPAY